MTEDKQPPTRIEVHRLPDGRVLRMVEGDIYQNINELFRVYSEAELLIGYEYWMERMRPRPVDDHRNE